MKELEFEVFTYTFDHQEARQRTEAGGYHYDIFYKVIRVNKFDDENKAKKFTFDLYRQLKKFRKIGYVSGKYQVGIKRNNFKLKKGDIYMVTKESRIPSDVEWWK